MKYALLILSSLLLTMHATAQAAPGPALLTGYVQAGYMHELWAISQPVYNGYSAQDHNGNGYYAGIGLRTHLDSTRHWGAALSLDYTHYTMNKQMAVSEHAQRMYAFARISPAVNYRFRVRSICTFTAQASGAYMAPLRDNERGYWQYGAKAIVGYKAYEASAGFNFSQSKHTPSGDIDGKWREQMFTLGIACYPSMLSFLHSSHKSRTATGKF